MQITTAGAEGRNEFEEKLARPKRKRSGSWAAGRTPGSLSAVYTNRQIDRGWRSGNDAPAAARHGDLARPDPSSDPTADPGSELPSPRPSQNPSRDPAQKPTRSQTDAEPSSTEAIRPLAEDPRRPP